MVHEELEDALAEIYGNAEALIDEISIRSKEEEFLDQILYYTEKLKVDLRVLENEIMIAKGVITRNDLIRP